MFKKKCKRCGKKIGRGYNFCPYCGYNIKRDEEKKKYGLLGREDELDILGFQDSNLNLPFGFNTLFSSLLKQIEKQFQELDKEIGKDLKRKEKSGFKGSGISISISTATGKKPEIRIKGFGPEFKELLEVKEVGEKRRKEEIKQPKISEEKARKLAKLPKKEAETKVRRLSNKIIYEIALPGVKRLDDVIINQLENSIEIKAFSKDKVYFKLLPLNLPILNYKLKKGKLILELKAKD